MKKLLITTAIILGLGGIAQADCSDTNLKNVMTMKVIDTKLKNKWTSMYGFKKLQVKTKKCGWLDVENVNTDSFKESDRYNFVDLVQKVGVVEQLIRDKNNLGIRKESFEEKADASHKAVSSWGENTALGQFINMGPAWDCSWVMGHSVCYTGSKILVTKKQ